jgi:trimeric autotransporter adhesin
MKKIYFLLFFLPASLISFCQPLTGIKNIPGDYASISAAVADLNAQGVGAGGVTFNITAGHTETLAAALVVTIATNPSSATRPVTFQRTGTGANPLITAFTGTSALLDGIFIINGADYITIDGIDLQENSANTTNIQLMEWGYALLRTGTNNGSQYNTIRNCSITLNKANTSSIGIYSANHTTVSTTNLNVNNFLGTNSYNKYYNNTVQNCFHGIDLNGHTGSSAPYDFYDKGNEIGTTGSGRNQVLNFGGGAAGTANGITCNAQNLVRFSTLILTIQAAQLRALR